MPFPLSRRAEIVCKPASDAALLMGEISEELRKAGLQNVRVATDRIHFVGGKRIHAHFGLIDEGEVKISTKGGRLVVSYSLRFKGLLSLTAAFAMLALGLFGTAGSLPQLSVYLFLISASWVLGQVGTYIQTVIGFTGLMKRALEGV